MSSTPRRVLGSGRFLRLQVDAEGWESVERVGVRGVVLILAVTEARELLLVEQFRPPVAARVVELPAGLVGDQPTQSDEHFETAARRELLEETGFEGAEWRILFEGPISSGLSSECVTCFEASGLRRVSSGGGVDGEDLEVHRVPLDAVETWLQARRRRGALVDPKIYAALYYAQYS